MTSKALNKKQILAVIIFTALPLAAITMYLWSIDPKPVLVFSVPIRLAAFAVAVAAYFYWKDWRVVPLALMFFLMAARQVLTIHVRAGVIEKTELTTTLSEVPGFIVTLLGLTSIIYLWKLFSYREKIKETGKALLDSEKLLRQAQKLAKIGHWELSLEENVVYWSDEIFNIFDIDPRHFKATYKAFVETIHPDDRELVNRTYLDSVAQKNDYSIEHRIMLKNGLVKWVHEKGGTQYDELGTPIRSVGTVQDITASKKREEERLQLTLQKEQFTKLESLKTMAGAIAHRFNNSMMAVQGNLDFLTMTLPDDSDEYEMASDAAQAAKGASQVGTMMLSYVGQRSLQLQEVSIAALVKETVTALKNIFPATITLSVTPPDQFLYCSMDQQQIKEVTESILANASESMEDNTGTIKITFGTEYFTTDSFPVPFQSDNLQDGMYTFCEIQDSGHGITPNGLARIFEPFYTTKFVGRGLGLALTVGIMQSHHGAITIKSSLGKGTTTRILLPSISSTQKTISSSNEISNETVPFSGDILLFDDE